MATAPSQFARGGMDSAGGSATLTITPPIPAGSIEGKRLKLTVWAFGFGGSFPYDADEYPDFDEADLLADGWTQEIAVAWDDPAASNTRRGTIGVYTKIAGGSETAQDIDYVYDGDSGQINGTSHGIRGEIVAYDDATEPLADLGGGATVLIREASGASTTVSVAGVTIPTDDSLLVIDGGAADDVNSVGSHTLASVTDPTERLDSESTLGGGALSWSVDVALPAGATGNYGYELTEADPTVTAFMVFPPASDVESPVDVDASIEATPGLRTNAAASLEATFLARSRALRRRHAVADDRRAEASIVLRRPDGDWTVVGTEEARGIVAQGLRLDAGAWGPESASFTLARRSRVAWPDLTVFNQAEVWIAGAPVWGGRLWRTPGGGRDAISVEGRGWHHHWDDDQVDHGFVLADLGSFKDLASIPGVPLGGAGGAHVGQRPSIGGGEISLAIGDDVAYGESQKIGVQLDLGETRRVKRLVVEWESSNNSAAIVVAIRGHDAKDPDSGSPGGTTIALDDGASGTFSGTFTTARRYLSIYLALPGSAGTTSAEHFFRIKRIVAATDTAYESGGYSALRASDVFEWVATSGAAPLLSTSTALIEQSGLIDGGTRGIPELWPAGYQSVRELLRAANAYHAWDFGVDAERRPYFRPLPTTPEFEIGEWSGAPDPDEGLTSGQDLYNRIIVEATGPDGEPLRVVRTATSPILDRQGFTRTHRLQVSAASTEAALESLGDAWLAENARTRFAGSTAVATSDIRRMRSGEEPHPAHLLRHVSDLVTFTRLIDPDTGALGRNGRIRGLGYDHTSEKVTLSIDSRSGLLEPVLERWGAISGQVR